MTGGGIGRVRTERVVLYDQEDPLILESGASLAPVKVAYETYGTLDAAASNVVFVCHALTGDAHAAGHYGDPAHRGWWDNLIGPGTPARHRSVLRDLPESARWLPGHHGPVERRSADRARLWTELSPVHRQGPHDGAPQAAGAARDRSRPRRRSVARSEACRHSSGRWTTRLRSRRGGADRRQRAAERSEHRLLGRRPQAIMRDPEFAGGAYLETDARPDARPRDRADDGPHHVPVGGVDAAQVRPRQTSPGAR